MSTVIYTPFFDFTNKLYILNDVMQIHYVYKITNNINSKFYIGKHTHNIKVIDKYYGGGNLIHKAIKKYGKQNFKKEIIAYYKTSNCALIGESQILTYDVVKDINCYNLKPGGEGGSVRGRKMSNESITKRTMAQRGLKRSDEFRIQLGNRRRGSKHTELSLKKMSAAQSGKNNANYGKPRTEETKQKISNSQKGENGYWHGKTKDNSIKEKTSNTLKKYYEENTCVRAMKVIINNIEYKSLSEAESQLGITRKVITTRCRSNKEIWNEWQILNEKLIVEFI